MKTSTFAWSENRYTKMRHIFVSILATTLRPYVMLKLRSALLETLSTSSHSRKEIHFSTDMSLTKHINKTCNVAF